MNPFSLFAKYRSDKLNPCAKNVFGDPIQENSEFCVKQPFKMSIAFLVASIAVCCESKQLYGTNALLHPDKFF